MKAIKRKIRSNLCISLVLLAALVVGPAGSANAVTYREDFEVGYFNGAELQYHLGWFQTRSGTITDIGNNNGVDGSYGLTSGNQSFIWIAHPFSWSDLNVDDYVIFQMDFKTETSGTLFDDDRIGWITKDDNSGSSNIFGVQLDPGGGGYNIECYWRNSSNERVNRSIVTISPTANTWYRLEGKFTKKSATSAKIDVKLWALSDLVNPVASGSIADTSAISPEADRPDTKYFTATTVWPVFKNYDGGNGSLDGEVDNAYFHIEDGFDDVAEVEVTDDSATEGGGTGEFKLRLQSQPSQNVNITCIPVINGEDIDLGGGAGLSVTKTFTNSNWSTWQSVTATAYNDDETEASEIAWIDFSISSDDDDFDGHYAGPLPVRIKIDDNDNDDQSAALVAGPYLMYTNEAGKMMVLWILDSSPTCTLEWDEDEDFTLPLTGSDDNISHNNSGTHGYQYRYTISSLSTSTKYYYRLTYSSGGKSYKYTGSFSTAPASSATNVKFLAYGDTRGNGGDPAYGHDPVCSGIMDTLIIDPGYQTFLLHVADWIENGNYVSDWEDNYFNRDFPNARTMVANIPVQGCFGNHEGSGTLFDIYLPYPYFQSNVRYGSFDYGPVHVAVVDTEEAGFPSSTQENWLKADMKDTTGKWKFILLHRPGWSAGGGHGDNGSVQGLINRLESYLDTQGKAGTDIVFAGHNHYYARCKKDTVCHITTGGGGAPLHNPNPTYTTYVEKVKGAYNFCEIYIRDKVLRCRARARTGSKIEVFTLLHDGTHYYVKPDGSNSSNGQSWDTAFKTISYAITQAQNGDLIEVAEGTYEESIDFANKSIIVTSTDPEDSSVVANTIIDANSDSTNSGRVVTFDDGEGAGSVLTGFTITGGYAPGTGNARDGGGIFCDNGSSPSISNCFITGNYAGDDGGGIFCDDESEATISNCTVYANEAGDRGGGMYCRNSDSTIQDCDVSSNNAYMGGGLYYTVSEPLVKDCTISENSATGIGDDPDGGGIHCDSSDGTITNCIITNNNADDDGGGIFCDSGSEPEISNCTISGNEAGDKGGGMYCRDSNSTIKDSDVSSNDAPIGGGLYYTSSDPLIDGCTISDNETTGSGISADGGGIYLLSSDANIISSDISDNSTNDDGGGIFCDSGSDATITNCKVIGNDADDKGGGIYSRNSIPEIVDCVFKSNTAVDGGGLYCRDKSPTIDRCVFSGNTANDDGGGIHTLSCGPTITNCLVCGNDATDKGGGMYLRDDDASLTNCTITDNTANYGGGIYNRSADTIITNCILWDDTASTSGNEIYNYSSTPVVSYSDVKGGYTGEGNIDTDPKFADPSDPDGGDNTFRTHDDGLRLNSDSPCIDKGNNSAISKSKDIVGNDRKIDGDDDDVATVDMGAYEYVPIAVTHIKFDHTTGDSADGINIRENYSTDITVPEWVKGGQNKPAAYKKSTSVSIKAKFYIRPKTITSAKIKATTTDSIFGNLGEQTVTFSNGVSNYISFTPTNSTPSAIDKGTVTWQWKIRDIQGGGSAEYAFGSSGAHTIYTVLATPQAPQAEPWTQVLDKSCVWASGEQQNDSILEELANDLYDSGLTYNGYQSHYRPDQWPPTEFIFDLTDFFSDWNVADCQDCAMFLSCLSGSLGCTLTDTRRISGVFWTKKILPIGYSTWGTTGWNFHQIGWDQNVYDACLNLKETDPYLPVDVDIDNPYKTDLFNSGNWSPVTPFTLISDNDPYWNVPTDVN